LKVTLDFLLGSALAQLEMDGAIIQSLNPYSQTLNSITSRGIYDSRILRSFSRMGDDLAGICALERRLIQEPNLEKAAQHSPRARLFKDVGFNSYYAIPLIAKGQVKGVLEVFSQAPYRVTGDWINFFTMLSTQAAIAIDNGELFDNLQRSNMDLMVAYDSTLEGWASALELRDEETEGHARRVTEMTERLAIAVGVQGQELNNIRRGALLHDIGKMGIPDQILLKPGPLNDEEWKVMRTHPELAYKLIAPISFLRSAIDIPYCHHEKWDGTGYPRNLKAEDIPLSARLFAIIDVWDALSSDRPYRKAWDEQKVYDYLLSQTGSHFDPNLLKVFLTQVFGK
jgi:HD-GYP domain-containing protein (c-di-GMP phosphodiesterase class II)